MKKVIGILFVVFLIALCYFLFLDRKSPFSDRISTLTTNSNNYINPSAKKTYIFIPYWTFSDSIVSDDFDSLLYFGVMADVNGINRDDPGFEKVASFMASTKSNKERILSIRMTDASINSEIIKNPSIQGKIIDDSIEIAKEYGFDGILVDFETSAFGFENTTKNISDFYSRFSVKVHENKLLFYTTLFGDSYYRARAYDIKHIGKISDKVLVMTYDFHKSRGNPGPNFPLRGNESYGYDLGALIKDYQKDIDNKKLIIVLGYFGYDWQIDKNKEAISNGVPLSTNKIQQDFVNSCVYKKCSLKRNSDKEPYIEYIDTEGKPHVVWFEDEISIKEKLVELSKNGINQTGFWAYSYY